MLSQTNKKLIREIADFFFKAKKNYCLLGLSGGIDSAHSALLHVAALGAKNVALINFPSRHNSHLTKKNAASIAQSLKCQYLILPIDDLVKNFWQTVNKDEHRLSWPVLSKSDENIQARIRGQLLAGLANYYDALFPCNANKNELLTGYGTLYGDLTGYACPLGNLWKSEVYQQAKNLAQDMNINLPPAIFQIHPSAELSPQQSIEQNLGDPMTEIFQEKLLQFWSQNWGRAEKLWQLTEKAWQANRLPALLKLNEEETKNMKQLFPHREDLKQNLELIWQLFTGPGQFKKKQIPPILGLK